MKIIFDIDGTATEFNKFIDTVSIPYFEKKYGMKKVNEDKLEVEDKLDMYNFFMKKTNSNNAESEKLVKKALNDFWVSPYFLKYIMNTKLKPGFVNTINEYIKNGHEVSFYTSRAKTTKQDIIGNIARTLTILQFKIAGVKVTKKNFNFFENDNEKVETIKKVKPTVVFDDKPEVIKELEEHTKIVCVQDTHNKEIEENKNITIIKDYDTVELKGKLSKLLGKKTLEIYERSARSDIVYSKVSRVTIPLIKHHFKPIVLNSENRDICKNEKTIYAPNHRSTWDPVTITADVDRNIHWAALARFFDESDSIFNNSKNPTLCKITSNYFKGMEYFPIVRKSDDENADNMNSIKDMNNFIKNGIPIGICAEGTTLKDYSNDFGEFDDAFLHLAKRNDAFILPIGIYWPKKEFSDYEKNQPKAIINYGNPFKVGSRTITEAKAEFLLIQQALLTENREYVKNNLQYKKSK